MTINCIASHVHVVSLARITGIATASKWRRVSSIDSVERLHEGLFPVGQSSMV